MTTSMPKERHLLQILLMEGCQGEMCGTVHRVADSSRVQTPIVYNPCHCTS
uniref:Uncharacterized protein n=1 Tax=Anguilla anguilla TaxID=7936 RepID=A0A0E9WN74_ANGAN